MKLETAEAIKRAADVIGVEVKVHPDYSGRGMFGKSTVALSGDKSDLLKCTVYAAYLIGVDQNGDGIDEFMDDLNWRWDSLGYDAIGY